MCPGNKLTKSDLDARSRGSERTRHETGPWMIEKPLKKPAQLADKIIEEGKEFSIKRAARIMEEELIRKALKKTKGNRTRAARILEISHPALLSKIKGYGIDG